MDLTVVELDLTPDGEADGTALGALVGLLFLLVLTALARWARHNR